MRAKWIAGLLISVALPFLSVTLAFAQEAKPDTTGGAAFFSASVITMGFALALAALFGALGQSRAIVAALDGMARQPGLAARIQLALIIGLAFIESLVIYVLLIALLLFFANPYIDYVVPGR